MSRAYTVAQKRGRLEEIWAEAKFRSYGDGADGFKAWCSELFYVRSKTSAGGRTLFDLYDFQREAVDAYFTSKYVVALKARQMGFTTLGMAYALWKAIYKPGGATVLILSKTQVDARANLQMVKHALSFFPDWYSVRMPQIEAESNDRLLLRFPDGTTSQMECMVATERSGASRTADLVVADECALWAKPDDTMRSIAPATDAAAAAPGNEAVMLVFSTARGGNNYFAHLYRDAAAGRNQYKSLFFPWYRNPLSNPGALSGERDYSVYNARKSEFAAEPHKFASEYPETPEDAFKSSGHARFGVLPSAIEFGPLAYRGNISAVGQHAAFTDETDGLFHLSFDPREGLPDGIANVVIGADPALGVGNDSSTAYAVAYDPAGGATILGYFSSNTIEPLEFAEALYAFGHFMSTGSRPALIACEFQPGGGGGGQTVVGRLRDRGYINLYRFSQPASRGNKTLSYYGMPLTRSTKPVVINNLAEWLTPDELSGELRVQNIPPILRDELGTFVVKPNGTTSADVGCHDDHVLAVAIALYVLSQNISPAPKASIQNPSVSLQPGTMRIDMSGLHRSIQAQQRKAEREQRQRVAKLNRIIRRTR